MTSDLADRSPATGSVPALPEVMLASPDGALAARFVPAAGMLCSSLRDQDEELLAQGAGITAYATDGATMGVPLLYPWANRLARHGYDAGGRSVDLANSAARVALDDNGLPIHGAIPCEMPWQLKHVSADGSALSAALDWDAPSLLEIFPFPHRLGYEARVSSSSLTVTVTVRPSAELCVPVSFGFHPYLSLGDPGRREWVVDLPVTERLVLDETMIPTGAREPASFRAFRLGESSWDDAFAGLTHPARFTASSPRRTMTVEFLEGYRYAQVYSPPDSNFICFEPMTAPTNALRSADGLILAKPGSEYRASFRVTVG